MTQSILSYAVDIYAYPTTFPNPYSIWFGRGAIGVVISSQFESQWKIQLRAFHSNTGLN